MALGHTSRLRLVGFVLGISLGGELAVAEVPRTVHFVRACGVHSEATMLSRLVCNRRIGEAPRHFERADGGFVRVEFPGCVGYVPMHCLSVNLAKAPAAAGAATARPARQARAAMLKPRRVAADEGSVAASGTGMGFELGIAAQLALPFASVSYASGSSKGLGYGFGVVVTVPIGSSFSLAVSPSYSRLRLSREVGGSKPLSDSPADVRQEYSYLGLALLGSYALSRGEGRIRDEGDWWLDGGLEFMKPLSASQTLFDETTSVPATDRLLLALFGPRGDFAVGGMRLSAALHGFYNLASSGGSRLLGARLAIALHFAL